MSVLGKGGLSVTLCKGTIRRVDKTVVLTVRVEDRHDNPPPYEKTGIGRQACAGRSGHIGGILGWSS